MHEVGGFNPFTIYKITVATGIEEQVIPYVGGEYEPRYSPDGTRFAWQSYRHGEGGDIFIADVSNPAGSQTRVTPYSGFVSPTWSPDGSKLAFNSSPGDLWAINADGTGLTQLTSGPATDVGPWWGSVTVEIQVAIDIKPGSFPNSINLGSGGTVPVAILSSATFDATTVDPLTVTLANARVKLKGKGTPMASFQDINDDGLLDLVVHVSTEAIELSQTDTEAVLEGQTFGGTPIRGVDSVRVVP
jgi:hypothetical protein